MARNQNIDATSGAARRGRWINALLAVLGAVGFAAALYRLAFS